MSSDQDTKRASNVFRWRWQRKAWLRRPFLLLVFPVYVILGALIGMVDGAQDWKQDWRLR